MEEKKTLQFLHQFSNQFFYIPDFKYSECVLCNLRITIICCFFCSSSLLLFKGSYLSVDSKMRACFCLGAPLNPLSLPVCHRWVREFLNDENRGLDVLVEYLSFAQCAVMWVHTLFKHTHTRFLRTRTFPKVGSGCESCCCRACEKLPVHLKWVSDVSASWMCFWIHATCFICCLNGSESLCWALWCSFLSSFGDNRPLQTPTHPTTPGSQASCLTNLSSLDPSSPPLCLCVGFSVCLSVAQVGFWGDG